MAGVTSIEGRFEYTNVKLVQTITYGYESWAINKQAKNILRPQQRGFTDEC